MLVCPPILQQQPTAAIVIILDFYKGKQIPQMTFVSQDIIVIIIALSHLSRIGFPLDTLYSDVLRSSVVYPVFFPTLFVKVFIGLPFLFAFFYLVTLQYIASGWYTLFVYYSCTCLNHLIGVSYFIYFFRTTLKFPLMYLFTILFAIATSYVHFSTWILAKCIFLLVSLLSNLELHPTTNHF